MANSLLWLPAATVPVLADNELHVWRASLDLSPAVFQRVESTLDAHEKKRAEKFLVPQARERFVAARGILRELLGAYLELDPENVALSYGPQGKPSLLPAHNSKISFNVAHSQGMGLFVFASGREVGVDIERLRPDFRGMEIASHFFSEDEIAELKKLPQSLAEQAFFGCWTRKEAYVKAQGEGLSIPLRSFTVGFAESAARGFHGFGRGAEGIFVGSELDGVDFEVLFDFFDGLSRDVGRQALNIIGDEFF